MSGIQRILLAGNADKIASNFATQVAANYQAAIVAAGGSISATQLAAVKAFVKTGYKDRWWFTIIDCCLFLGADLTSALVKIVAAPGAGASYVNHNCVSGDYGVNTGITVTGNTTKYLGTGVVPTAQGLGLYNISVVYGTSSASVSQGQWGCDEANAGLQSALYGAKQAIHGNISCAIAWSKSYCISYTAMPSYIAGAMDGIGVVDFASQASTGAYSNEIEMFRFTAFGNRVYSGTANAGFFSIGVMMTIQQSRSMTAAALKLHRAARSIATPTRYVYLGDSITHGQGTSSPPTNIYPTLVSAARSAETTNLGISGSEMMASSISSLAGRFRYKGTESFPIHTFFCMLGANDITGEDHSVDGDPVVIALYTSYLVTMANYLKGQGARVVILSISYETRSGSVTKNLAWVDGALAAATTAGVIGIDCSRPMIATGDPGQFLQDTVHLNDAGHALVRDLILAVI